MIESDILIVPEKETVTEIVSQKSTSSIMLEQKYNPRLDAFYLEGDDIWIIFSILDRNGNFITPNGEMTIRIFDFDDDEIFKDKAYLVQNSYTDYTNVINDEKTKGMKFRIPDGKIKPYSTGGHIYDTGMGSMKLSLVVQDEVFESVELLDHLPYGEGFFNKDTGYVTKVDVDQTLKLGNFYVKVRDVGHYIGLDSDNLKDKEEYFRVNLNTKSTDVEGVTFTLDEVYLEDSNGNIYVSNSISTDNFVSAFLGESFEYEGGNGYLLFESIPRNVSEISVNMKISKIGTDMSQTTYEDSVIFSLN